MNFNAIDKKETLAEKVANTVKEAIVSGEIKSGETISTEPELAKQFNVSRAVIRDAAHMLMAWGLIEIRHGKGMYVTREMNSYFLEAISTILRRKGTSLWEMQEYEQLLMPEVFARAAESCTDKQKSEIEQRGQSYIDFIRAGKDNAAIQKELFLGFIKVVFEAGNNRVFSLMGQIQQFLRELRTISEDDGFEEQLTTLEEKSIRIMIEAVNSGDKVFAKKHVANVFRVGPDIEKIMRTVPMGQMVSIPAKIFLKDFVI